MTEIANSNDIHSYDILVVDDNVANLGLVATELDRHGYRVRVAESGDKALERAALTPPDLILLDVMMPVTDGFETCRRLKAQPETSRTPIIFMTALTDIKSKLAAFEAGAVDYVTKPLQIDEVVARVGTQLELDSMRKCLKAQNEELAAHRDNLERIVAERTAELEESNNKLKIEIEERRSAQEELAASEQQFRSLAESLPDPVIRYDLEQRILYLNNTLMQILGFTDPKQVLGKSPMELWPDGRYQVLVDASHRAIQSGELQEVEIRQERVSERFAINQIFVVPELDANGQIIGTIAISRDITAIRESEIRLKHTIDSLPGLAFTLHRSPAGGLSLPFVSPNVETTLGFKPQDAIGNFLALHNVAHPDDRADIEAAISQSAQSMEPFHIEYRSVQPQRQDCWFDMRAIPEAQNDGGILWYGIMLDITIRKQAETKLQASEQRFRTLADNLPDNVARFNLEGKVVYANPPFQKLAKIFSGKSPIGKTPTELFQKNKEAPHYQHTLGRVMETGHPEHLDISFSYPSGERSIYQMSFVAERRENGDIRGALVIGRDITVLKETEQQLKESNMQITALAQRRETAREEERIHISRELHDDLGQYLTALSLHTSALNIEFSDANPAMCAKLEMILSLVNRTKKVARDLSRKLRPVELDMGIEAALHELIEQFSSQYGINCELSLDQTPEYLSDTHAAILYRVVQESLTNIARHAEANHVAIVLQYGDGNVTLEVSDDGKGFDPAEVKSTSFGLVGMRERLLSVGGEVEIDSEPQRGTRVIAHLPTTDKTKKEQESR